MINLFKRATGTVNNAFKKAGMMVSNARFGKLNVNKWEDQTVFGNLTIREGEKAAIWSRSGKLEIVDGPNQRWCKMETVRFMLPRVAQSNQYLSITYRNGETSYVSGPTSCHFNPTEHYTIDLCDKWKIGQHEAIVVYKPDENGNKPSREILRGPMLYSPATKSEWVHQFKWHFPDQVLENKGLTQSGFLRFSTIRLLPDHIYFDIPNVRTKDDALIRVKTMIFFSINDLEKMLDSTHDPINVMINGMIADITEYTATKELDHFKENSEELNVIGTYPQLTKRSENIGYEISKVVFRGFESHQDLQNMHDNAIKKRTEIKLQKESEKAKQELEHFILKAKVERHEQEKTLKAERSKQQTELKRKKENEELKHLEAMNDEKMRYYKYMRDELKCDVAELIRAESEKFSNTKIIRIDGNSSQMQNLHHHIDSGEYDNARVIAKTMMGDEGDESD